MHGNENNYDKQCKGEEGNEKKLRAMGIEEDIKGRRAKKMDAMQSIYS